MKKHQVTAIILGVILSAISFLPVIFTIYSYGFDALGSPVFVKVFFYPTIGVAISAIIVFVSFFWGDKGK